jgi:hypothetical protein
MRFWFVAQSAVNNICTVRANFDQWRWTAHLQTDTKKSFQRAADPTKHVGKPVDVFPCHGNLTLLHIVSSRTRICGDTKTLIFSRLARPDTSGRFYFLRPVTALPFYYLFSRDTYLAERRHSRSFSQIIITFECRADCGLTYKPCCFSSPYHLTARSSSRVAVVK